jgi:hypothetical protein
MKGFMTVRKWIDRSIAGLETRSGDYPIVNTKNVAIIVMLSGLENIPRITELKEIRAQSNQKERADPEGSIGGLSDNDKKNLRDDMITLPVRRARAEDTGRRNPTRDMPEGYGSSFPVMEPVPQKEAPATEETPTPPVAFEVPRQSPPRKPVPERVSAPEKEDVGIPETLAPSRRRVIVTHAENDYSRQSSPSHTVSAHGNLRTGQKTATSERSSTEMPARHPGEEIPPTMETERQRIERELRRQRTVAIGGQSQKNPPHTGKTHPAIQETQVVQRSVHQVSTGTEKQTPAQGNDSTGVSGEKRTIIIGKRKTAAVPQEEPDSSEARQNAGDPYPDDSIPSSKDNEMSVEIRDRVFRARDEVFEGKGIRKPSLPQARDSTLLHTDIRPKKRVSEHEHPDDENPRADQEETDPAPIKKRTRSD